MSWVARPDLPSSVNRGARTRVAGYRLDGRFQVSEECFQLGLPVSSSDDLIEECPFECGYYCGRKSGFGSVAGEA